MGFFMTIFIHSPQCNDNEQTENFLFSILALGVHLVFSTNTWYTRKLIPAKNKTILLAKL